MDERRDELRGFTIDRVKELCGAKHIKVYGKTKDVLIEQLLGVEFPGEGEARAADEEKLSTTHLLEMVRQMRQDQRAWLEAQQKAQKEMLDAVPSASRASIGPLPTIAPADRGRTKPPKPTLQKLSKEDDIESYLDMLERVARQQGWPKELWTTQLTGLLSGEALDAFVSVPSETAHSYDAVKEAILARFLVNAETYRLQFRGSHRRAGESYKLLLNRQTDLLKHWTQSAGSELNEIVLLEQFLLSLPTELAIKLRERSPGTAKLAAEWADDYDLAHKGEEPAESKPVPREMEGAPKVHRKLP